MSDPFAAIEAEDDLPETYGPPKPPALPPEQVPVRNPNPTGYDPNKLRNPGEGFGGYLGESVDAATRAVNYGIGNALSFGNADEIAGSVGSLRGKGYAESRDAYREAKAAADAASPYSMDMAQSFTQFGMGAASKAGLGLQAAAGALQGVGDSSALDSQAALNAAVGAAAPFVLPGSGAAVQGVRGAGRALGNVARDAIHSPNAPKVASTILAKAGGAVSGSTAGGALDAVLPVPGVGSAVGGAIGMGASKPNAVTDAAGDKMVNYLRSKIGPRKVQLAPEDLNYRLPQRAPVQAAEPIPVPAEPTPQWPPPPQPSMAPSVPPSLSLPPKPGVQSMDDFLGPESIGAATGRPAALGAVPKGAPPAAEIGINPLRMGPEDYRGEIGPDYANFVIPPQSPVPEIPMEVRNTLRPPMLPQLSPSSAPSTPYIPNQRPIPPSIQEPPSFAAINAPTTPWKPPTPPAGAAVEPPRFTMRLEQAAASTQDPAVLTTLEKIADAYAQDPMKGAARHSVEIAKNPAYRETMRIIEGK